MELNLKKVVVAVCMLCNYSLFAQPDIIFYNGNVITMNPVTNVQEAIAVEDGKIVAVGADASVLAIKDKETVLINLTGRTLMPGFVDAHAHLFQQAAVDGQSLEDVQTNYLMNGITTLGEPTVEEEVLKVLQDFSNSGKLIMNMNLYLRYNNNCNDPGDEWFIDYPATSDFDATFRIAGVKIFTDGGTCGTIAALTFEYPAGGYGDLFLSQQTLEDMLTIVNDNGYQALLHAQGDAAVNRGLDALAEIMGSSGNPLRHRIDHNSFINPVNMSRYSDIGISPVIFGFMDTCTETNGGGYTNYFGEDNVPWLENWRLMHDENPELPIGWHSDAPNLRLDPISHMASYVTRMEVDEGDNTLCDPPAWLALHALTIEETLQVMTIGSAYTLNRETSVGSLEVGKQADFVFLSENPLTIPSAELFDLQILGTMAKGIMRYCQEGSEDLCSDIVTGLSDWREEWVSFFPNPTNDAHGLIMEMDTPAYAEVTIYNAAGQVVFQQPRTWVKNRLQLDWDNAGEPGGIYMIHAVVNGMLITRKILLEH
ncbi:MAG: amidohydrolase family protein [Cyclobacteriaceae bacterium]